MIEHLLHIYLSPLLSPNKATLFYVFCTGFFLYFLTAFPAQAQDTGVRQDVPGQADSVKILRNEMIILDDTLLVPYRDTVLVVPADEAWKVRPNPYYRSTAMYDSLEHLIGKQRVSNELFKLFFRPIAQDIYQADTMVNSEIYYEPYRGGIIDMISVEQVPLLRGDVTDPAKPDEDKQSLIRRILPPTSEKLIRKNVLFNEGDTLDPFLIADSERLLRTLPFIRDARIYALHDINTPGNVSIKIVIQPRFPLSFSGSFSGLSNYSLIIGNRNIAGSGNQLQAGYVRNKDSDQPNGFLASFASRNLGSSFIQVELSIADHWEEDHKYIRINKPFVSPRTRLGGEFEGGEIIRNETKIYADSTYTSRINGQFQDIWIGRAINFGDDLRSNLTGAVRAGNYNFDARPVVTADSNLRFQERKFLLGALNYQYRRYLKSNYIYSFGITEDLPVGYSATVTAGKDFSEFGTNTYIGGRVGWAYYYPKLGYVYFTYGLGGLRDNGRWLNKVNKLRMDYFMPILMAGNTRVRNFARLEINDGIDAFGPQYEELEDDIRGLSGDDISPRTKWNGSVESVFYLPGALYAFRFAPYAFADFGALRRDRDKPCGMFYTGIGAGCRIRNESLVFRTLEFHFTYYPEPPVNQSALNFFISLSTPFAFRNLFDPKPRVEPFE